MFNLPRLELKLRQFETLPRCFWLVCLRKLIKTKWDGFELIGSVRSRWDVNEKFDIIFPVFSCFERFPVGKFESQKLVEFHYSQGCQQDSIFPPYLQNPPSILSFFSTFQAILHSHPPSSLVNGAMKNFVATLRIHTITNLCDSVLTWNLWLIWKWVSVVFITHFGLSALLARLLSSTACFLFLRLPMV